jgi:hypothetical protein
VAYEVFERSGVRVGTPALTIAPGGRIFFNAASCRLLIETEIKTVVILWDKATNRIAVRAARTGEKNSYTVSFSRSHHSAVFAAKSFLHHIGWNGAERETLATTWNAAERMFEATLPAQYLPANPTENKGAKTKREASTRTQEKP